ncbi:MAG: ImmA/IrrE family metallo-endopeptidase [Marmoricola sp.]
MADRTDRPAGLSYDPYADLADRYPDWTVGTADLGGVIPEVLSRSCRVVLLEASDPPARQRCSLAHAVAHLDLGHAAVLSGFFENREELQADELAAVRLVPVDLLGRALGRSRDRAEVAHELQVDEQTLRVRERMLTRLERRTLRRGVGRVPLDA